MARKQALPNLTTVRLLAALYVFDFHFTGLLRMGNTAVNLFFVLSGFILAYNHPSVPDRRRFFAFRFARIYPLYAVSLLIGLPQFLHAHRGDRFALAGIPLSFVLLQTWIPPLRNTLNFAGWTLPVEAFFYLCFPFLLPFVHRGMTHWKQWIGVLSVLLVLPTAVTFFAIAPAYPAHSAAIIDLLNIPLFHLGEFAIGMFLGLRFLEEQPRFHTRHVLAALLLLVMAAALASRIPWTYVVLVVDGLLALPYGILIYVLAGWQSRWFAHPLLQLGGEISYGMYLLQFQVAAILLHLLHYHVAAAAYSFMVLTITTAAAYVCYLLVEKPARRWILHSLGYHATPKPIPTPGLET